MLALRALRLELGAPYRQTIDLLSGMSDILDEIWLTQLPHFTVLRDWFERIPMRTYRAFLGEYQPRNVLAIPFFDRFPHRSTWQSADRWAKAIATSHNVLH